MLMRSKKPHSCAVPALAYAILGAGLVVVLGSIIGYEARQSEIMAQQRCRGIGWGCEPGWEFVVFVGGTFGLIWSAASLAVLGTVHLVVRRQPLPNRTRVLCIAAVALVMLPGVLNLS